MNDPIYLDYNATAPLLPPLAEKMRAIEGLPLNPSSIHSYGRRAKKYIEDARKTLAELLAVWPDEIIFTASGTESNNMALGGLPNYRLAVAATEHSSVINVAKEKPESIILPVDESGLLRMDALEEALRTSGEKTLVSVMLANNETGVIQPIKEIAERVHAHGALLHCDAVQAFGKMPFDFGTLGADMLTVAAHKIGGPVGVGVLVVRNDLLVRPLLRGGGQEKRRRAGTENVAAIAGFGWLAKSLPDLSQCRKWINDIEKQIVNVSRETLVAGRAAPRLNNTLNLTMPGVSSETQLMNFDLAGICVSAGSACSSGRIEPSHVLRAMGYSDEQANCALRISLGWATTETEVKEFIAKWLEIYQRLGHKHAA